MLSEIEKEIISLIDYTSLNDNDSTQSISSFLSIIFKSNIKIAGVCIYPQFVGLVKRMLINLPIKVVTVVNFPSGDKNINEVILDAKKALEEGADEIDVVINYKEYNSLGCSDYSKILVSNLKQVCGNHVLKVIIESGELKNKELIALAAKDAINSGANFVKTSTGKVSVNATLEAAEIILKVIKESKLNVGFKASGGIKTLEDAMPYVNLSLKILGEDFISPNTLRIGASSLLTNIINKNKERENNEYKY